MARSLKPDGKFDARIRRAIAGMIEAPTLKRLADDEGLSVRTLQRRLADHGTSFSTLVQDVRRETALQRIETRGHPLSVLAKDLGYTCPSTLTRAVRRWTGKPPSRLRPKPRS